MSRSFCFEPNEPTIWPLNDFWQIFTSATNKSLSQSLSTSSTLRVTCTEESVFVWIATFLLVLISIIEWCYIKKNNSKRVYRGWTVYFVAKYLTVVSLLLLSLFRIFYWLTQHDTFYNFAGVPILDSIVSLQADVIRALSLIYIIILAAIFRRRDHHSSIAVFVYLSCSIIFNLYPMSTVFYTMFEQTSQSYFRSPILLLNDSIMVSTKIIYFFGLIFLLFLVSLTDRQEVSAKETLREQITNPEEFASVASKLTFEWLTSLIMFARKIASLQMEHLWVMSRKNSSENVSEPFDNELKKNPKNYISIVSLVFNLYWNRLLFIGFIKLIASLFIFVNPIVLDWLIDFMKPESIEPLWKGFFYCSLMFISPMLESILTSQHEYLINLLTMHIKICLTECIYGKSFKLSNATKMRYTTGEIVNLLAVDTQRIVEFVNQINIFWSAPLQIFIGLFLLWQQLGISSLAGFSYMILIIPLNLYLTRLIRKFQQKMMLEKDQRSKLMNEILNGIKVIKLNAWSDYFLKKVSLFRSKEIAQLRNYAYMNGLITFFFSSASFFVALLSFLTFVLISSDNILNPNRAFVSLALFNIIRVPLAFLPMLLSSGGVALVSINRINEYLNSSEMDPLSIAHLDMKKKSSNSNSVIQIHNGTFSWLENDIDNVLKNIDIDIKKNQLIAIVGGVGSGKSSLLYAILGDMFKKSGNIQVNGRIAFVPQEAWIRNATIRENIILDQRYDSRRYKSVIEACSLNMDFALFSNGDLTEVGEKGINLSGGQKQRISLARAVYSGSEIFLFDDPLSALDAHVSKHIFDGVIGPEGSLKKKTRILVTHKLSLLTSVDNVIYINHGSILEYGSFSKLIENKGPFSEYVAKYFLDRIQDSDETDETEREFMENVRSQIVPVFERLESTQSRKLSMSLSRQMSIQEKIQNDIHRSQSIQKSKKDLLKNTQGKLIQAEKMAEGSVSLANHSQYFKTIGIFTSIGCIVALIISNIFQVLGSLWLTEWSNDSLDPLRAKDTSLRDLRLGVYAMLGVLETISSFIGTLGITLSGVKASKVLHNNMLSGLMSAPMSFFDTTPMGRILNRFTRDVDVVDLQISVNFRIMIMQVFRTIVSFGLISLETPIILVLIIPLSFVYYIVQRFYINFSRQLKRIEAVSRSPINNCLSETVSGATSIRTYGLINKFTKDMHKKIDTNNQSYWLNFSASRWLAIRLEFLSYTIVFVSALFAVLSKGSLSPGIAGLAISYSLNITSILNLFIRGYTDTETNFVSVERLVEYMNLPKERQNEFPTLVSSDWPENGEIVLENYSTQYRPGLPLCLKRLNAVFRPGSKIAVVGRTGSGKSSLALSLFRIIEPVEGTIKIDNVDIRNVTQQDLRSALSIVPQDPVLFTGSLRSNVDLRGEFSDEILLKTLRSVNLGEFLDSIDNNLDYQISGTVSESLSAGQKQLICLSRAMVRNRKIVVFDEATALVDYETDCLVDSTIFSESFKDVTVIMIAHRLDHILSYDYVLVMNNGEIQEFDHPNELIKNENSAFYSMAKEAKII